MSHGDIRDSFRRSPILSKRPLKSQLRRGGEIVTMCDMSRSFGWIFWGLIVAHLNFIINGHDLLIDVIGYGFVAVGCHGLAKLSGFFRKAALIAWFLAGFKLVDSSMEITPDLLDLVSSGAQIAMIWMLLDGIIHLARRWQWERINLQASKRRLAYAVLATGSMLLQHVQLPGPVGGGLMGGGLMGGVVTLAMLVVMVLILVLVHRMQVGARTVQRLPSGVVGVDPAAPSPLTRA